MRMRNKLLLSSILITSLLLTSCSVMIQQKHLAEIERLLTPLSDSEFGNKTVACAIVSIPSKLEMQREYEKVRKAKPQLSDYAHRYTPATGRELDAFDKKRKRGNEHFEEQYTKMTEAERNERRRKDYNRDLNSWEKEPAENTEYLFKNIDIQIAKFSNTKGIRVVDRNKMDAILAEHSFQSSSAWASEKNIAEVGKALNAQYLVYVKPVIGTGSTNNINFECINVTTFQKIVLSNGTFNFREEEIQNLIDSAFIDASKTYLTNIIEGTWFCKGVMSNGYAYTEKTEPYLSPFSSGYSLDVVEKIPKKYMLNLANAKLSVNGNLATISKGGSETECVFSYVPADSKIYGGKRSWEDTGDANYTVICFDNFWAGRIEPENSLTDCSIGEITIIPETGEFSITGKAYKKGSTMAIHLGSDGKRKRQHYYLVFTKLKG